MSEVKRAEQTEGLPSRYLLELRWKRKVYSIHFGQVTQEVFRDVDCREKIFVFWIYARSSVDNTEM